MKRRAVLALAIVLMIRGAAPASDIDPNFTWDRAAYWDVRYPTCWTHSGFMRDALEYTGYQILDANQLKTWMDAHIADGMPSVVVFCQDVAPDTIVESMSSTCTLRQYLNAGGKIVWYADIPIYYQGHVDGSHTVWGVNGSINVLGFNAAGGTWDSYNEVVFTADGVLWGLTETWQSRRPTSGIGLRVLAEDANQYATAWVKHYVADDAYRGFVRLFDRAGEPNFNDVRRAAEYPHVPAPIDFDNQAESEDDIIGVFFYPWYANPNTSGLWRHWNGDGCLPPITWAAYYLPNYPDSTWNPSVQLYDSADTEVLRWQDRAMARAGIDIAIASWWGIGGYEDAAFAKAIRTCKSVQWCIYYEMEGYSDPTPQKIYDDIKYVVDTYGPTRNYAKIDGKWLVLVYVAGGEEAADRWRQAKAMLANDGYNIYLNGDVGDATAATAPDPWDSIHRYNPTIYQGLTDTLPDVDDSAWIAPGFWKVWEENPRLEYSLSEFTSAWNNIVLDRERSRFKFVETWNEWHEGTQIQPGQEIVPDPNGYYPAGYDYGYDFIDAIAPTAVNELRWQSSGHRPEAPIRLEAEEMVWQLGTSAESPTEWRISEEGARIGASVLVLDSNDLMLTVRARGVSAGGGIDCELVLYLDDVAVGQWAVQSSTYRDYCAVVSTTSGIHKVEVTLANDPGGQGDVDLVVDFVDVHMPIAGDISADCFVDMVDFATFALAWLTEPGDAGWNPDCDISTPADNSIDMLDVAVFVDNWLAGL